MDIEYIKSKILFSDGKIKSLQTIKKEFPEILDFLEMWPSDNTLREKIYNIAHDIKEPPKCQSCFISNVRLRNTYNKGYFKYCSHKCSSASDSVRIKKEKTMTERYGVRHNFCNGNLRDKIYETCFSKYGTKTPIQSPIIKEKYQSTMIGKYGVSCNFSLKNVQDKIEETNIEKYGCKRPIQNPEIREKIKKTNLEKYGSEWILFSNHYRRLIHEKYSTGDQILNNVYQSELIKNQIKQKMLEIHGVENAMQKEHFFLKSLSTSFRINEYYSTGLTYQGTYELYFLDLMKSKGVIGKVSNGLRFSYELDKKRHYYFSDFYIPSLNMIVEIKSSWTYDKNGKDQKLRLINEIKRDSVIELGYDYRILINKDKISEFVNALK